ncbi:MAG: AMP-binding protein [Ignavibacteria bacterium]|nr:AMP-binding protein [Ignavibacteria bacterium]
MLEDYPLYDVDRFETFQVLLNQSAGKYPNKLALEDLNPTPIRRLTFAELRRAVMKFGKALRRLGLQERDHIAIISENRVQWGVAYFACTAFNYVAVPIDAKLKENEIVSILHASDAKAAIFSENYRDMFQGFRSAIKELNVLVDMDLQSGRDGMASMTELIERETADDALDRFPPVTPSDLAVLVFTSGSMGSAKGVMLSQANICANLVAMLQMVAILPEDRFLSVLPIHHTYECTCGFLCPLTAGASVHYARSLKTIVEDLATAHPTVLLGVPLLYEKMYRRIVQAIREKKLVALLMKPLGTLVDVLETAGVKHLRPKIFREIHERFGGSMRILIVGGAAPDPGVAKGLRGFGFTFIQGYGLTETSPILALNRLRKCKDEAAGIPLPNVRIRIDQPDAEGSGEIYAKAPSVMLGYYKNEAATNAAIDADGWFRTGDCGFVDGDGFLHINGRKKNVIIARNGKNVFPEEIEELVNKSPYVLESIVHAAKDAGGDEEIAVLVVPNAEAFIGFAQKNGVEVTPRIIREVIEKEIRQMNKALPVYKQIRKIAIKDDEFEKTTSLKIKRYLVRQDAGDR